MAGSFVLSESDALKKNLWLENISLLLLKNAGRKRSNSVVLNNEDFVFLGVTSQIAQAASSNVPETVDNIRVPTDDYEAVRY